MTRISSKIIINVGTIKEKNKKRDYKALVQNSTRYKIIDCKIQKQNRNKPKNICKKTF